MPPVHVWMCDQYAMSVLLKSFHTRTAVVGLGFVWRTTELLIQRRLSRGGWKAFFVVFSSLSELINGGGVLFVRGTPLSHDVYQR